MNRRQLLKGIAAGSALTVSFGTAAGRQTTAGKTVADLTEVHVVRDGERVRRVENPDEDDLSRLWSEIGEQEQLTTSDDCDIVECCSDCYNCCMCGTHC